MVRHAAKPKKKKGPAAAAAAAAAAAPAPSEKAEFVQQVSRKGSVNALSTAFLREDDSVVAERKVRAQDPFGTAPKQSLVLEPSGISLGLPLRPPVVSGRDAKAQQLLEEESFDTWLAEVHARCGADPSRVSPFEHNLEVWRQLWRTLERSDVVAIVADVRNPLLHVPAALYDHVARTLRRRLVIVLSKVDLVSAEHLAGWRAYLAQHFPEAKLADFSSQGRPVGGSLGGGVNARRRTLKAPLTPAEARMVRAYVAGVLRACGAELPREMAAEIAADSARAEGGSGATGGSSDNEEDDEDGEDGEELEEEGEELEEEGGEREEGKPRAAVAAKGPSLSLTKVEQLSSWPNPYPNP